MKAAQLSRDEEAVSAAVAAVLLFGGVLSIIGVMLITMIPVIQELEGSVEKNDMQAQMMIMANEVTGLSERGMPGDRAQVELATVDGTLQWDNLGGGMWYSATWFEGHSFRIDDALDLDRQVRIRHSESHIEAVCFSDMRTGKYAYFHYSSAMDFDKVMVTPAPQLTTTLERVVIEHGGNEFYLSHNDVLIIENPGLISSNQELMVLGVNGDGGATHLPANDKDSSNGQGRSWTIPLLEGNTTINILSEQSLKVEWSGAVDFGEELSLLPTHPNAAVSWSKNFQLTESGVVNIITSNDAQLYISQGGNGIANVQGEDGSYLAKRFITPTINGELMFTNPQDTDSTVTWRQGGVSVPANSSLTVEWPPVGQNDGVVVEATTEIMIQWSNGTEGINELSALDSGLHTGSSFLLQSNATYLLELEGEETTWYNQTTNTTLSETSTFSSITIAGTEEQINVLEGDPLRITMSKGSSGLTHLESEGTRRCVKVDQTASGWIEVELPWKNVAGRTTPDIIRSWNEGIRPAGLTIELVGHNSQSEHAVIASAWAFQLSRLTYTFATSITGLEVAWSGGAVMTNHPELEPLVLRSPIERGGPGPRFAATIPALHPDTKGLEGQGKFELEIDLERRSSLASREAFAVRRGWYGPYGGQIASLSSQALDGSEDWTTFPGQLGLLDDYIGWVPIPSHAASEAVWHTGGQTIQFTLQIADMNALIREA